MDFLAVFYWNYSKFWFSRKFLGLQLDLRWYGLTFSLGIFVSVFLGIKFLKEICLQKMSIQGKRERKQLDNVIENFLFLFVLAIVIGARLGEVFFYSLPYYIKNPIEIFKIWEGGLSSHGAILGLLISVAFFVRSVRRYVPNFNFLCVTDIAATTFGFAAFMIRLGNLFNQEIVGTPTTLPWGVAFSNPIDGFSSVFLHPVQLYEGFGYLIVFVILMSLFLSNKRSVGQGWLTAIACLCVSSIRFIAEFFKSPQGMFLSESNLISMGQLLSIPLFLFGIWILVRNIFARKKAEIQ